MITFSRFGKRGRLGNQLFHLAGMIGLSRTHKQELRLPPWHYKKYFQTSHTEQLIRGWKDIDEDDFHYSPDQWSPLASGNWDVAGWLQCEKYWEHCKDDVRSALTWDPNFEKQVLNSVKIPNNAIAISIRRGDYVGNKNYDLLPVSYYMQALMQEFPDWMDRSIMIFSDDIAYCKIHFAGLPNVWFADGLSDVVQLCVMSKCSGHVIANSTFSWWGAYLAELKDPTVKVVRPAYLFDGPLKHKSDSKDHWPERWVKYDHKGKKYDLKDVTFTIPVMYDHQDRKQNLELMVCLLQKAFDTNVVLGEITEPSSGIDGCKFMYMSRYCYYNAFQRSNFHRTHILNALAAMSHTPIIANWDADVCVPEVQVVVAAELIRKGRADGVYPYDGRFARVPRKEWFNVLEKELDMGIFKESTFKGTLGKDRSSVGGAVIWNKDRFFEMGGENEHFISHAPEDAERWERSRFLGYRVLRVAGQLFHMDHWVGPNSSNNHGFREQNGKAWAEFQGYLKAGDKEGMWEWIKGWPWYKKQEHAV